METGTVKMVLMQKKVLVYRTRNETNVFVHFSVSKAKEFKSLEEGQASIFDVEEGTWLKQQT